MSRNAYPWKMVLASGLSLTLGLMPIGSAFASPPTPQTPAGTAPAEGESGTDPEGDPEGGSDELLASPEASAMDLFAQGEEAYNAAEYSKALEFFQDAQSLYPSAVFHYNIGQCLEALEKFEQAIVSYKAYMRSSPDDSANVERKIAQLELLVKARSDNEDGSATAQQPESTPQPTPQPTDDGPEKKKNGVPLIAAGGVLVGLGAVGIVIGGVVFGRQAQDFSSQVDDVQSGGNPQQLTLAETRELDQSGRQAQTAQIVTMSIGGALAAAGVALIALGAVQRKRASSSKTARFEVQPTVNPGRGRMSFGLTGRF